MWPLPSKAKPEKLCSIPPRRLARPGSHVAHNAITRLRPESRKSDYPAPHSGRYSAPLGGCAVELCVSVIGCAQAALRWTWRGSLRWSSLAESAWDPPAELCDPCRGHHPAPLPVQGRKYYDRKRAEGKNAREATRALKPQISNVVFRALVADAHRSLTQ